jgi:hypothetical protein
VHIHLDSSIRRSLLAIALVASAAGGCQAAAPTPSPTPTANPTPTFEPTRAVADGGTIVLSDTGCSWTVNPGAIPAGRLSLIVRNETDDYATFDVHRIKDGRTWEDGQEAILMIQEALRSGSGWPEEVFDVSDFVVDGFADAGADDTIEFNARSGTFGVVCSATAGPTGDVLKIYLAGPLEITKP